MLGEPTAPVIIILMPNDNVGVAARALYAGEAVMAGGLTVEVKDAIPLGHKIALRAVAADEKVVRWGVPIGSATQSIAMGEHVHVHNLRSDYIPTFTLDRSVQSKERAR